MGIFYLANTLRVIRISTTLRVDIDRYRRVHCRIKSMLKYHKLHTFSSQQTQGLTHNDYIAQQNIHTAISQQSVDAVKVQFNIMQLQTLCRTVQELEERAFYFAGTCKDEDAVDDLILTCIILIANCHLMHSATKAATQVFYFATPIAHAQMLDRYTELETYNQSYLQVPSSGRYISR